jgi:hypothetical protein
MQLTSGHVVSVIRAATEFASSNACKTGSDLLEHFDLSALLAYSMIPDIIFPFTYRKRFQLASPHLLQALSQAQKGNIVAAATCLRTTLEILTPSCSARSECTN